MEAVQTTLFKDKPKPKRIVTKKIVQDSIVNSEQIEEKNIENQTYASITLKRSTATNVKGEVIQDEIQITEGLDILPYPQEQSHYGGFWGLGESFSIENINKIFDYLLDFKRRMLELPYTEDFKNADRFMNLKAENVLINVSDKTKEFIEKKTGRLWDDFLKEWHGIKNIYPTERYKALAEKECEIKKKIEDMESYDGEIDRIESTLKQKLNIDTYSLSKSKTYLEYQSKSPAELIELLESARNKLKELGQEAAQVLNDLRQEYIGIKNNQGRC